MFQMAHLNGYMSPSEEENEMTTTATSAMIPSEEESATTAATTTSVVIASTPTTITTATPITTTVTTTTTTTTVTTTMTTTTMTTAPTDFEENHENDVNIDGNEVTLEEMQESSDSEAEIELSIYEKRRERNAWLTVLAEKLFAETKKRIYHEKKNLLDARLTSLLNQDAEDYKKKREEIYKEHNERLQYIEVTRALRTESLRRKTKGQRECAEQNLINNKRMAYERIEADIEERMQKLDDDLKRCTREYKDFCREFEKSKERERRKQRRDPVTTVVQRLLGDQTLGYMNSCDEDIDEDLRVCEQALRAVNGCDTVNGSQQ